MVCNVVLRSRDEVRDRKCGRRGLGSEQAGGEGLVLLLLLLPQVLSGASMRLQPKMRLSELTLRSVGEGKVNGVCGCGCGSSFRGSSDVKVLDLPRFLRGPVEKAGVRGEWPTRDIGLTGGEGDVPDMCSSSSAPAGGRCSRVGLGGNEKDRDRLEEKDSDGISEDENALICAGELLSFSLDAVIPVELGDDPADTRLSVASLFPTTPCLRAISPRVVAEDERERSDQLSASEAVLSTLVVLCQRRMSVASAKISQDCSPSSRSRLTRWTPWTSTCACTARTSSM